MKKLLTKAERETIINNSQPVKMIIADHNGNVLFSEYSKIREFSSGSLGYNFNGKLSIETGDKLQVTSNLIVIGSKPE
jgi:hypothetical protein